MKKTLLIFAFALVFTSCTKSEQAATTDSTAVAVDTVAVDSVAADTLK